MNKSFVLATILYATLVFGGSLLAPVEIRFVESITSSTAMSGVIFGGTSMFLIFLSYFLARVSNKIGRHRTILIGTLFGVVYSLLYASVVNTLGVLGVKFAWAVAVAATNPILAAYVQTTLAGSKKKGRYFGYYYSVASIVGSGGALLGGYIFESSGFASVAYILAVTYILAFILTLFLPAQRKIVEGNGGLENPPVNHSIFSLLRLLFKKPELRFYCPNTLVKTMHFSARL